MLNSFDYNEKLLSSVNEIEVNPNSFVLNHQKINTAIQTLLTFSSPTGKEQVTEFKPYESQLIKTNFNLADLDEIPNKLESGLSLFKNDQNSLNNQKQLISNNYFTKKENDKNFSSLTLDLKKPNAEQPNVKISISKEKTKLKLLKTTIPLGENLTTLGVKKPSLNAKQIQNWSNFSQASELLNKYSRNLYLQHSNLGRQNHISNLTNQFNGLEEKPYFRPRFMTGYEYPDLSTTETFRVKLSNFINPQAKTLTISYYPQSVYFSQSIRLNGQKNVKFIAPIYQIEEVKTSEGNINYLIHDFKTADLALKNRFLTQLSFFQNAILNNVETTKPVYFFSNLEKADLKKLVTENDPVTFDKTVTNQNNQILRTTTFFGLLNGPVNSEEINQTYNQVRLNQLFSENVLVVEPTDLRSGVLDLLPHTFTNTNFKLFVTENSQTLPFEQKNIQKPQQVHLNISNQLIGGNNEFLSYSSNLYKREIGSYWKTKVNQQDEFLTLNEVLTSNSLLSVSLIGFLISSFLILKTAYADYAKEFSSYLLDLISSGKGLILDPSTIEWLNQELGLEEKKGGIRVFPKNFSKKRFTDIAGIKTLLPELSELVWFLRNKGRKFNITPLTSKSILLVGPPGTGKTLLVQALAGEAEVPVVAQSTSVLSSMNQELTPGDAIRLAFQKARSLAPCILFLDELDSLGLKRDALLTNNSQQIIGLANEELKAPTFFEKTNSQEIETSDNSDSDYLTNQLRISITNEFNSRKQQEREQVAALTQLLIEIDGLQTNAGILVIGATNRAHILDPALTRPGRFSKIISLPLPDKAKRVEIFKLRAVQLGWEKQINWNYLAQRTKGFSAGDLTTIVNQSAIQAILDDSKHTLESFETAITVLTTYPSEKPKVPTHTTDPYYLKREVYYKVAQSLYNYYSDVEEKPAVVELSPRQPNPRHYQILANVNNDKNRLRTRFDLEKLLVSLVAGKAGELLMLLTITEKNTFYWESDLAKTDFYEATKLVLVMLQDWYLYTNFLQQQKFVSIPTNQNQLEYRKNEELFSLFEETVRYLDQQITGHFSISDSLSQRATWKMNIIADVSNADSLFAEWSRFHLPDPQETERNPEWIPPEEYYNANENKRYRVPTSNESSEVSELLSFSELTLIERDRYIQNILISSFNKAFDVLEMNRELLDVLACFLYKNKILRSFELENLIQNYKKNS
jgi:ATP-dependent Zn protease